MTSFYFTANKLMRGVSIAGMLLATGAGTPAIALAEAPQWKETLPALRMQVDARRNRVWVLNLDAVYLYDIPRRRLIKRIELPDWMVVNETFSCAPDLALAPSGAALVTSNVLPVIWEIDPQTLVARQHRLSLDADNDKDVGFTGLAFGPGGRNLFGVSSLLGSAWRINLAAGKAHKVRLSGPIHGACGLVVADREISKVEDAAPVLCIAEVRNARRVELTSDMREGRTILAPCSQ